MDNINLYYHKDLIKGNIDKYIAIPIKSIETSFILEETKINIFQEIILELFKCGYSNISTINEVLNLDVFDEKDNVEGLGDYILKELKKFKYIDNDNKITDDGLNILEDNYTEEKILGKIFYNYVTKKYENFIYINDLYKQQESENGFIEMKISLKNKKDEYINFGTLGTKEGKVVTFLSNLNKEINTTRTQEFDIEKLMTILTNELREIRSIKGDLEDRKFLSEREYLDFLNEKQDIIEKIRKFKYYKETTSYILVALVNGHIRTSISPQKYDDYLRIDLMKIHDLKEIIKESAKSAVENSLKSTTDIRKRFKDNEKTIIENSNGILEVIPELVKKLAILSQLNSENQEISDEDIQEKKVEQYGKIITTIYECFAEVFLYLYRKHKDVEIDRSIKLNINRLLKDDYNQPEDIIKSFLKMNVDGLKNIELGKKIKDLFIVNLYLENKKNKSLIKVFIKKNSNFFEFIKHLTIERNRFSHSSNDQNYTEDVDLGFGTDAKEMLINLIEHTFNFKFKGLLKSASIDPEQQRKYQKEIEYILNLEFSEYSTDDIWKELKDIYLNYKYYSDLKNSSYKNKLIKSISILIELNLIKIRKYIDEDITLDDWVNNSEKVLLGEIDDQIFKKISCTENKWINDYFEKESVLKISIDVKKIKFYKERFKRGTINVYTAALILAKNNHKIKKLVETNIDFFKLAFIISMLRGHNGDFILVDKNNTRKEIEAIKKLIDIVFETEKKLLKTMGDM